jgi:hypothetical protein
LDANFLEKSAVWISVPGKPAVLHLSQSVVCAGWRTQERTPYAGICELALRFAVNPSFTIVERAPVKSRRFFRAP